MVYTSIVSRGTKHESVCIRYCNLLSDCSNLSRIMFQHSWSWVVFREDYYVHHDLRLVASRGRDREVTGLILRGGDHHQSCSTFFNIRETVIIISPGRPGPWTGQSRRWGISPNELHCVVWSLSNRMLCPIHYKWNVFTDFHVKSGLCVWLRQCQWLLLSYWVDAALQSSTSCKWFENALFLFVRFRKNVLLHFDIKQMNESSAIWRLWKHRMWSFPLL